MDKSFANQDKTYGRRDGFILIGAALPRTGTTSLKHALQIILPGFVSHMFDISQFHREWETIYSGNASDNEFRNFFLDNGFVAGVDAPFCFHYKQAMRAFPEAKVLLVQRDPEKWIVSVSNTVGKAVNIFSMFSIPLVPKFLVKNFGHLVHVFLYFFNENSPVIAMCKSVRDGKGEEYYWNYQKEVEEFVPSDKLLKFSVKDGWEPLCKFLDVEVPDVPFPHLNDSKNFAKMQKELRLKVIAASFLVVLIPIFTGIFCYRFFA